MDTLIIPSNFQRLVSLKFTTSFADVALLILTFFLLLQLDGTYTLWFAKSGPSRLDIPACEYKYLNLKNMHVTGFRAAKGQIQFLLHVVENAPAMDTVTVDTSERLVDLRKPQKINPGLRCAALDTVRGRLRETLPPNARLYLL
jgi:hypothetical protein